MAEITEHQIYEAFGIGEQEQEPAEPAANTPPDGAENDQGEKGQEPAEPAIAPETQKNGTGESQEEPEAAEGESAPGKGEQTPEERRANAARRRQAETQAAIDKAVQSALAAQKEQAEAEQKAFFEKANLKNTITGEPITNMEQFNTWSDAFAQAKLQRELKAGKLTPEALQTAIGNHPAIKQAEKLIQERQQEQQNTKMNEAKERIDAEIAEIHKLDASVNSVEDLLKAPYGQELYAMTKKGYSLKDAHFLLNHEKLEQAKLEAVKQQGALSARSKDHMTPTGRQRGGGSVSVPQADLAMFRQFNPNASDEEIQAYYNKYLQGG